MSYTRDDSEVVAPDEETDGDTTPDLCPENHENGTPIQYWNNVPVDYDATGLGEIRLR